jgi:hypothetical protein
VVLIRVLRQKEEQLSPRLGFAVRRALHANFKLSRMIILEFIVGPLSSLKLHCLVASRARTSVKVWNGVPSVVA